MTTAPGTILAQKYRVVRDLGEGGMGTVVLATHLELRTSVAIKLLRKELSNDRESVARFSREALATASLGTAHVVRIFDAGRLEDGQPFLVMEYLEGCDLGAELSRRGRIPYREAIAYVIEACRGVSEAHRLGIVHRDLKPANLFLAQDRDRRVVKVLDFGISHMDVPEEVRMTQTQSAFGTPLYMSPEAIRSARLTDARTDVWALGVILYELVVGTPPFEGESATAVAVAATVEAFVPVAHRVTGVPAELDAVLACALSKSPDGRFKDAGELGAALEAIVGAGAGVAHEERRAAAVVDPQSAASGTLSAGTATSNRPRGSVGKALLLLLASIVIGAGVTVGLAALFLRLGRPRSQPSATAAATYVVAPSSAALTAPPASEVAPSPTGESSAPTDASAAPTPESSSDPSTSSHSSTRRSKKPPPVPAASTTPARTLRAPTTPPLHL